MIDSVLFNTLRQFRAGVYQRFGSRRDALFELLDGALVAGLVPSLAHVSLTAVHRRGWGSLYDALASDSQDAPRPRDLVSRSPLDDGQPIYALDTSVWPCDDAETSPARVLFLARAPVGRPADRGRLVVRLARADQLLAR
jgi:hypothetical protein